MRGLEGPGAGSRRQGGPGQLVTARGERTDAELVDSGERDAPSFSCRECGGGCERGILGLLARRTCERGYGGGGGPSPSRGSRGGCCRRGVLKRWAKRSGGCGCRMGGGPSPIHEQRSGCRRRRVR